MAAKGRGRRRSGTKRSKPPPSSVRRPRTSARSSGVETKRGLVRRPRILEQLRDEQGGAAATAWTALTSQQQQRLAWEAASSRADELRRAFPSLVAIGAGFRVKNESSPTAQKRRKARNAGDSAGELTQEPCVVFTVARKWKPRSQGADRRSRPGELPKCLFAYVDDAASTGGRRLVSIPTDVRDRRAGRARPLTGQRGLIAARHEGMDGELGILTCAVRLPGRPGFFAMGAHHVLAMSLETNPPGVAVDSAQIILRATNSEIGSLILSPIGSLLPGEIGFDAALAEVSAPDPAAVLRDATGGMRASDYWRDPGAFPTKCHVLVGPPDTFLTADFVQRRVVFGDEAGEIVYFGGSLPEPIHPVMLELWINSDAPRTTEPGESGCPVVTDDEQRLVGMHIGGIRPPSRTIWVIPATELFLASRWDLPSSPVLLPL